MLLLLILLFVKVDCNEEVDEDREDAADNNKGEWLLLLLLL